MIDAPEEPVKTKEYEPLVISSRALIGKPPDESTESIADEEEFAPSQILRQHPLAQALAPEALKAPLLSLSLLIFASVWRWQSHGTDLWSVQKEALVHRHEFWRAFTSILVHADLVHLLSNASLFVLFAWFLGSYFGAKAFPLLSFAGGALTMALTALSYEDEVSLLGASGMVYFMCGLWLFLFARHADYLSLGQRLMRILAFILVVLVPTQWDPSVSYRSHAIGLVLGLGTGLFGGPWLQPKPALASMGTRQIEPDPDR